MQTAKDRNEYQKLDVLAGIGENKRITMKISILSLTLFFGLLLPSDGGSFARDVMGKSKPKSTRPGLDEKLRELAIPLDEYKKKINAKGLRLGNDGSRHLDNYVDDYNEDDGENENEDEEEEEEDVYENEDDYYVNEYNYVNYTGYSFKYAKCQPVQRFSQSAVEAGEYSPMVINDIVILRLCDSMYCSDSRGYGCNTDYVEYAIELTDYIRIMLRYEMDRSDQLCDWCDLCINGKQDERRASTKYYYTYDDEGNLVVNEEYVDDDDFWSNLDCSESDSYCYDSYGYSICDDGEDDNSYMGAEDYLDVIDCTQVNGGYFIRPRCDAYSETLTMGVYHDKFCTHYAGNEVSIEYFNLGINQTYFQQYGKDAGCQDCAESEGPPYFNANSNLCNRLDVESARCTSSTTNELFVNNSTTSNLGTQQCSFMDSVRYGTYDGDGKLSIDSSAGIRKVTTNQKWLLVLSMLVCGVLAVYSCYLHHAITNMLIKSLSHTDLLPPSKYRRRANSSGVRRKGGRRTRKPVNNDEDEDEDFAIKKKDVAIA